jgi:hypothetical protein
MVKVAGNTTTFVKESEGIPSHITKTHQHQVAFLVQQEHLFQDQPLIHQ